MEKIQKKNLAERERALERFKLLSAAGPDGQEPKATFRKGSVLVLSDQERFPPGTILRETYFRPEYSLTYTEEEKKLIAESKQIGIELVGETVPVESSGPYYLWYCLGDFDPQGKSLRVFESAPHYKHNTNTSPVYVFYEQPSREKATSFVEHKILAEDRKAIEFAVGLGTTIHDQTEFMKSLAKRGVILSDNTTQVDVMMFGKKVKKEVKEKLPSGLKELVPQESQSAI